MANPPSPKSQVASSSSSESTARPGGGLGGLLSGWAYSYSPFGLWGSASTFPTPFEPSSPALPQQLEADASPSSQPQLAPVADDEAVEQDGTSSSNQGPGAADIVADSGFPIAAAALSCISRQVLEGRVLLRLELAEQDLASNSRPLPIYVC